MEKIQSHQHKALFRFLIIVVIIMAFKLLSININKPFWGHHDWNSVVYSNIARNYIRYGYLKTKLVQVTNYDRQPQDKFTYVTHYPPLLPIIISFSFRIFGEGEVQARITIVLFSLLLVYFIYLIGKEIHSKLMGIFAAASTIFLPTFLYFGKLPVHDTVIVPLSMVCFWAYIKFIKTNKQIYYFILLATFAIGGLIIWSMFYLLVALIFHQFIYSNHRKVKYKIYVLFPVFVLVFTLNLIHIKFLGINPLAAFSNFLDRANPYLTSDKYGFALAKYIIQELRWLKIYYTLPLLLGSIIFLVIAFHSFIKNKLNLATSLIFTFFIYGIIYPVAFQQVAFIHDYIIYYLLPFMVLGTSYSVFFAFSKVKQKLIFPLILVAILGYIFLSQFKYTQALLATNANKRGYDVAKVINANTASGQSSFITSNSYKEFQEVFIGYYSDRQVGYGESLPLDFNKKFNLIIRPKDHDPLDIQSKKLLDNNYPKYENSSFIWYRIN